MVRADAFVSTCAGTGGASADLCPATVASDLSVVRSRIVVQPEGEAAGACLPVVPEPDTVWKTITRRVHHAAVYNQLSITAPADPSCPDRYVIFQELTVTSGAAVIAHVNGTVLSVAD